MKRSDWITDGSTHIRKDQIIAFEPWGYNCEGTTKVYVGQISIPFVASISQIEEMIFDDPTTKVEE